MSENGAWVWAFWSFQGDWHSNCDLLGVKPEALGQSRIEGELCGEVEITRREKLWWPLQRKQEQIPCQCSRTGSPSSLCESCSWPRISNPAGFLSCKRAKDCGWSEVWHSRTVRNPAGVYLSLMDYISPVSCLYKYTYWQELVEYLLQDQPQAW